MTSKASNAELSMHDIMYQHQNIAQHLLRKQALSVNIQFLMTYSLSDFDFLANFYEIRRSWYWIKSYHIDAELKGTKIVI